MRDLAPLETDRIDESEEKAGDHRLGRSGPPWLVRGSVINSPQSNVIASPR